MHSDQARRMPRLILVIGVRKCIKCRFCHGAANLLVLSRIIVLIHSHLTRRIIRVAVITSALISLSSKLCMKAMRFLYNITDCMSMITFISSPSRE